MDPLDPPKKLHAEGLPLSAGEKTVAIVGARYPSVAGIEAAREFSRGLAQAGFAIVSGLAVGIDSVAHRVALEVGGYTVAVLGCGLNIPYPTRNGALRKRIVQFGTVLTEYPPDLPPTAHTFPRRNRIIAGISKAVVFVEGGHKSGGKITAGFGLDANRYVYAVPGSLRNPMAAGPNDLIHRSEATAVTDYKQIIDELVKDFAWPDADHSRERDGVVLDPDDRALLSYLDEASVAPERICSDLDLSPGQTSLVLARLEVRGWIRRAAGGYAITRTGMRVRADALHAT
jgi:DNA processing protein